MESMTNAPYVAPAARRGLRIGDGVLVGDLAHDVRADAAEWMVEEELDGFDDEGRLLVIDLPKRESYLNWPAPLAEDEAGTPRRGPAAEEAEAAAARSARAARSASLISVCRFRS